MAFGNPDGSSVVVDIAALVMFAVVVIATLLLASYLALQGHWGFGLLVLMVGGSVRFKTGKNISAD